jgi:hypothetical protein
LQIFLPGLAWDHHLSISASQVARITDVSHQQLDQPGTFIGILGPGMLQNSEFFKFRREM